MSWLKRFLNLSRRDEVASEIDREIDFHIAELSDELRAEGLSDREAAWTARRRFGNRGLQRERTRDADLLPRLERAGQDLRYAIRMLRTNPGFSAVIVLSLSMGIGANVAIFGLMNALLLRPLPVKHPEELVQIVGEDRVVFSNPIWEQVRDAGVLPDAFASGGAGFDLTTSGERKNVRGQWVSGGFFSGLGVRPAVGRLIAPGDDFRGCPAVAVLSYEYFRAAFGADRSVIGRSMRLSDKPYRVIGVVEETFKGIDVGFPAQLYVPLCQSGGLTSARFNFLRVMGRRPDGVSAATFDASLGNVGRRAFTATIPSTFSGKQRAEYLATQLKAVPAGRGISWLRDQFMKPLVILMGVAALVLIVTCANIANLLLARATARERELGIRLAIGASRGRLLGQLFTESLLLSLMGSIGGLMTALWGSRLLLALLESNFRGMSLDVGVDGRLLGFSLLAGLVAGLIFGMAPAWKVLGIELVLPLGRQSRAINLRSRYRIPRILVGVQLGVSMILIVGALLFVQTFRRLDGSDPGFDPNNVLIAGMDLEKATTTQNARAVVADLTQAIASLPGVESASPTNVTSLSGSTNTYQVRSEGFTGDEGIKTYVNRGGSDYFRTIRAPIIAGRGFGSGDVEGAPKVAVITQEAALRLFHSAAPLGKRFKLESDANAPFYEVVGVVKDAKVTSLREEPLPLVILCDAQFTSSQYPTFVVRYTGSESEVRRRITALLQARVPAAIVDFDTMRHQVDASITSERVLALLSGFFGGIGLLVAVIGLYGLMSYVVTMGRREIGIRMALGARRAQVLRGVLANAAMLSAGGGVAGIGIALLGSRYVASLLYGVSAGDLPTIGVALAIMAFVTGAASLVPAWRAARLDPLVVLKE